MKFDRRQLIQAALAGSMASIAGCAGSTQNEGQGTQTTQAEEQDWVRDVPQEEGGPVVFSNLGDMSGDPATQAIIDRTQEEYGIEVNPRVINPDEMIPFAQSRLQSQSQDVDLFTMYAESLWTQARQGFYEDLSGRLDHVDTWADSVREAVTLPLDFMDDFPYREGIYMAPIFDDMWLPYYNLQVMEDAGVDPEQSIDTFQQFIDVATSIKENTDIEYPVIFPYASPGEGGNIFKDLIVRHGGEIHDGEQFTFTSEPVVQAADFFMSLFNQDLAPPGVTSLTEGQATQQFYQGNAGIMMNGSSNIVLPGKDLPIDVSAAEASRIAIWPKREGAGDMPTVHLTPTGFALSVFSQHKEAATSFLNMASSPELHKEQLLQEGNTALIPEVYEDPEVQENVPYADVLGQAVRDSEIMHYPNTIEVRQTIYSVTQQAIGQNLTGEELANRLQNQV